MITAFTGQASFHFHSIGRVASIYKHYQAYDLIHSAILDDLSTHETIKNISIENGNLIRIKIAHLKYLLCVVLQKNPSFKMHPKSFFVCGL